MDAHPSDRDDPVVTAARAGDEAAFARLVECHRRALRVHCYRMVRSVDEAEHLVATPDPEASWPSSPTWRSRPSTAS